MESREVELLFSLEAPLIKSRVSLGRLLVDLHTLGRGRAFDLDESLGELPSRDRAVDGLLPLGGLPILDLEFELVEGGLTSRADRVLGLARRPRSHARWPRPAPWRPRPPRPDSCECCPRALKNSACVSAAARTSVAFFVRATAARPRPTPTAASRRASGRSPS